MHPTILKLKDGREFCSPIEKIRLDPNVFEHSYLTLFEYNEIFYFKDIESARTFTYTDGRNMKKTVDSMLDFKYWWEEEFVRKKVHGFPTVEEEYKLSK